MLSTDVSSTAKSRLGWLPAVVTSVRLRVPDCPKKLHLAHLETLNSQAAVARRSAHTSRTPRGSTDSWTGIVGLGVTRLVTRGKKSRNLRHSCARSFGQDDRIHMIKREPRVGYPVNPDQQPTCWKHWLGLRRGHAVPKASASATGEFDRQDAYPTGPTGWKPVPRRRGITSGSWVNRDG